MKKIGLIILTIVLATVITIPVTAQIRGNGDLTKKMHSVDDFNALVVSGARDVILLQGDNFTVEVETDANIQEYITLEVKNSTLYFGFSNNKIKKYKELKYYVTAPEYVNIKSSGASNVSSTGVLSGDNLKLNVSGASDVNLKVDYKNIITKISGASDVTLFGSTISSVVESSGASEFHGKDLQTTSSVVNASGPAHVLLMQRQI